MSVAKHAEHRAWAFQAFEDLQGFLNDQDFEGELEAETKTIQQKLAELRDGKYRVVILGAFNVGKSALVNAFLGDEYLPMILEECTTKITHIMKADAMRTVLKLTTAATQGELRTLRDLMESCGVVADVIEEEGGLDLTIAYANCAAKDLLRSLKPLVTMSADEDFPQVRSLRVKFDEICVYLPTDLLEDDIALIDSPGSHSISETNTKILQEIIPNSHLVICMLDSQNAGNVQSREFVEGVVKHRHRKLIFVINKADQLNPDEIDPKGRRGPSKDLTRALGGIVEAPEIFFVSALYALVSKQLSEYQLQLADLDDDNKIKIPWGVQRELLQSEEPTRGVADYLMERSNLAELKNRLLDYLYTENREGAILESACRFLDGKAWTYARPLQIKIELAKDVPRLDELCRSREALAAVLDLNRATKHEIMDTYQAMSAGGQVEGRDFPGYEAAVTSRLTDTMIQKQVVAPVRQWLFNDANFARAKQAGFSPLAAELEAKLDAFLNGVYQDVNAEVAVAEHTALSKAAKIEIAVPAEDLGFVETSRARVGALKAGLFGSYVAFGLVGAVLGGAVGGVIANTTAFLPNVDAAILAGGGAGIGLVLAAVVRGLTAKRVLREKLMTQIAEKVRQILVQTVKGGSPQPAPSVFDQLKDRLSKRRTVFSEAVQTAFDSAAAKLGDELEAIETEEGDLRQKQQEILDRLEPKVEKLTTLGRVALEIAEANAPKEASV